MMKCPQCKVEVESTVIEMNFGAERLPVFVCGNCSDNRQTFSFIVLPGGAQILTGDYVDYCRKKHIPVSPHQPKRK